MDYVSYYDSPIGKLTLASDGEAICGLWLEGQKYYCATMANEPVVDDDGPAIAQMRQWLDEYFAGGRPAIASVALAPRGSEFQQLVWRILTEIPYGELTTYGAIAEQVKRERGGRATSALAVGGAVGHNPISIIVPCHRVVGASGSLTGYAGGLDRKRWLLDHEGVDTSTLFVPKHGTAL